MIVCISTIGYGDFYPTHWFSRIMMVALLLINITVMSNFLAKFTSLLFSISSYDKKYDFENHLVVFGTYQDYFVSDFMAEIAQIDKIERDKKNSDQASENKKKCFLE